MNKDNKDFQDEFICSECGGAIQPEIKICPHCGITFDDITESFEETDENIELDSTAIVKRPLGVWVLTISVGFFAGVFPMFVYNLSILKDIHLFTTTENIIGVLLSLTIIVFAEEAWRGIDWARYGLVVTSVLHYLLIIINNINLITEFGSVVEIKIKPYSTIIRSVIWIVIIILYFFFNKNAIRFYKFKKNN